jgi:FKBP-type peptidyl-prolyl cis-trans isomerase SlyD
MLIDKPCVVTLTWRLQDAQGGLIDELADPLEFFVGGHDLLDKVEAALLGQEVGYEETLHLEPADAFGDYRPELVFFESRAVVGAAAEPGLQFEGPPPGSQTPGMPTDCVYTITEIYPEHVVLDGNHPLAGIAIRIALKVLDVREADEKELAAGSVGSAGLTVLATAPGSRQVH